MFLPRAAVVVLALVLASGCPRRVQPLVTTTAAEAVAHLDTRRAAVGALRARARLKSGVASLWTKQLILVHRPEHVRIDVLVPYGVALAIGIDAGRVWAFPPSRGVRFEGPADAATLGRLLGTPVAVDDLVDVLLGGPPARRPASPPTLTLDRDGTYRLEIRHAAGTQIVWLSGDALMPLRVEERVEGAVTLQVVFGQYTDGFPHELTVTAPSRGAEARLVFDHVEVNPSLDPQLFRPPVATDVRPIEGVSG